MAGKAIGLCFSGGGHRASIFSLGALLYLVDTGRHRDVQAISSVSGGSLTSGFLAVQRKPLTEMDGQEFDTCAANWARQIAGSPTWWWIAMGVHVLLVAAWILLLSLGWAGSPRLARWPWWGTQIVYLAAVCICARIVGRRSGGTFWGWWGTWLYMGILLAAVLFLFAAWWSPLAWWWRLTIVVLAACTLALRSYVADLAFRATVCGDKQLGDIRSAPRHVFCASEMHTGRDAFFCRDFIYSLGVGLGECGDLSLSTALQASANFPVAFPYRFLRVAKHNFQLGASPAFQKHLVPSIVLCDGGVYDNTGVTWFREASERIARLKWLLLNGHSPLDPKVRQRLEAQIAAMEDRSDTLVVVNSSLPGYLRRAAFLGIPVPSVAAELIAWLRARIPVIGELATLVRIQGIMYDHQGRAQSRQLQHEFFAGSFAGAVVSIEHQSGMFHQMLVYPDDTVEEDLRSLGLSDLPDPLLENYRQRAQTVRDRERSAVEERTRELRKRLDQLREQQRLEPPHPSSEPTELDADVLECQAELMDTATTSLGISMDRIRESAWAIRETRVSRRVATTFRPLGTYATTTLLRHGYLNCMNICHLLLEGFPRFDDPPTLEEMQQLAQGVPRKRRPSPRRSC